VVRRAAQLTKGGAVALEFAEGRAGARVETIQQEG
jgi:hypothetical protein